MAHNLHESDHTAKPNCVDACHARHHKCPDRESGPICDAQQLQDAWMEIHFTIHDNNFASTNSLPISNNGSLEELGKASHAHQGK
jgi:hypothetical protein